MSSIKNRIQKLEKDSFGKTGTISPKEKDEIAAALLDDLKNGGPGTDQRKKLEAYGWPKVSAVLSEVMAETHFERCIPRE